MNPVTIVAATSADGRELFDWRNDPGTRRASKHSAPIAWETHAAWFAVALASPDRTIYIGHSESKKIGCIRFDRIRDSGEKFLVSIVIAPQERGRGFGLALLRSGIAILPTAGLEAEIAIGNLASQRIFEACGFERIFDESDDQFLRYRRASVASSGGATGENA
jgi:RimJ/RimL family protein N-acetyltransferase